MEVSTIQDHRDFMLWAHALDNKEFVLQHAKYARIDCSFHMVWQQRSSGNRDNSQSGHALLVGRGTCKPICMVIKSKHWNFSVLWKQRNKYLVSVNELIPEHAHQ